MMLLFALLPTLSLSLSLSLSLFVSLRISLTHTLSSLSPSESMRRSRLLLLRTVRGTFVILYSFERFTISIGIFPIRPIFKLNFLFIQNSLKTYVVPKSVAPSTTPSECRARLRCVPPRAALHLAWTRQLRSLCSPHRLSSSLSASLPRLLSLHHPRATFPPSVQPPRYSSLFSRTARTLQWLFARQ